MGKSNKGKDGKKNENSEKKSKSSDDSKGCRASSEKFRVANRRANKHQFNYRSKEEVEFSNVLDSIGLQIVHVAGDGNCLFRAISDQLEGSPENHLFYRAKVVDYISSERDHFSPFLEDDEPFEKYVSRLRYVFVLSNMRNRAIL